jgi:hypothetical protein
MRRRSITLRPRPLLPLVSALLVCLAVLPGLALAAGSAGLFPDPADALGNTLSRANIEWRTSDYYDPAGARQGLKRRTLLRVFAQPGELLLLGSSAVGVGAGDIRVYAPSLVTGEIGQEQIDEAGAFSCRTVQPGSGRIASRAQELAGPTTSARPVSGGFEPCVYTVPLTGTGGLYSVVFWGPAGGASNGEVTPGGDIAPIRDRDLGVGPGVDAATLANYTSVAAWHVSVQDAAGATRAGRLFTYYLAMLTNGNGRRTAITVYAVTRDGYRYKVDLRGDPYGFLHYANRFGFYDDPTPALDNGDERPLYRNVVAATHFPDGTPLGKQRQDQLELLQGNARLAAPEFPLFFEAPDPLVLEQIGFATEPIVPGLQRFAFTGPEGDNSLNVTEEQTGTFTIMPLTPGTFTLVVSRDGVNFDPTNRRNAVFTTVVTQTGTVEFGWDGRDQDGSFFEEGKNYFARSSLRSGEIHVPSLDVENNQQGTTIELVNPPDVDRDGVRRQAGVGDEDCPPWEGGCFGAFYDDRGYGSEAGGFATMVGERNGALCVSPTGEPLVYTAAPYLPGKLYGYPPETLYSGPLGFDSRPDPLTGKTQRIWGFEPGRADWPGGDSSPTNPASVCHPAGGFGDKKGLDFWTYYPAVITTSLRLVGPTAAVLHSFSATPEEGGVVLRWATSLERETLGFRIYRSATGRREGAERVTPQLIPSQGLGGAGASYRWVDAQALAGVRYSYWLEEIELGGATREQGPALTALPATDAGREVRLALVVR